MIQTQVVEYSDDHQSYQGVIAWDDSSTERRPVVMIAHAYGGQAQFDIDKAITLAELGYLGFAIDVYGKGNRGTTVEESTALMNTLNDNRQMLLERMQLSLAYAKGLALADTSKIGIIGFCFGGKCVLDVARSGEDLSGVVSFHGLYDAPDIAHTRPVTTPILVLHGWDDPLASPVQTAGLAEELTALDANWEINAYGHTGHAFTNPNANRPKEGMFYSKQSSDRGWQRMVQFFEEVF